MATVGNSATQAAVDLRTAAVTMAARGRTNKDIAEAVGVHISTVSQWRQEPAFRAAMDVEMDRIRASLDAAIAPLIPKALGRYERVLDEGEDTHAVIVAKDLLDRQFGRAVQREERQTRSDIHVTVSYVHNRQSQVVHSTSTLVEPPAPEDNPSLSFGEASPTVSYGDSRATQDECAPLKVTVLRDSEGNERGIVLDDRDETRSHPSPLSRWIEADDE